MNSVLINLIWALSGLSFIVIILFGIWTIVSMVNEYNLNIEKERTIQSQMNNEVRSRWYK